MTESSPSWSVILIHLSDLSVVSNGCVKVSVSGTELSKLIESIKRGLIIYLGSLGIVTTSMTGSSSLSRNSVLRLIRNVTRSSLTIRSLLNRVLSLVVLVHSHRRSLVLHLLRSHVELVSLTRLLLSHILVLAVLIVELRNLYSRSSLGTSLVSNVARWLLLLLVLEISHVLLLLSLVWSA